MKGEVGHKKGSEANERKIENSTPSCKSFEGDLKRIKEKDL